MEAAVRARQTNHSLISSQLNSLISPDLISVELTVLSVQEQSHPSGGSGQQRGREGEGCAQDSQMLSTLSSRGRLKQEISQAVRAGKGRSFQSVLVGKTRQKSSETEAISPDGDRQVFT